MALISTGHSYNPIKAAGWAIIGNFFFASENAIAKVLTYGFHPVQILFFYGLTMLVMATITVARSGGIPVVKTGRFGLHTFRSLTMIATFYTYILALSYLPLADVIAIMFVTPFVAILLSILLLSEKIDVQRWFSLIIAFSGVLIIVQPNMNVNAMGVFWAAVSAFLAGLDTILTRKLTASESNVTIVFYLSLFYVVVTGIFVPFYWIQPDWNSLAVFLGMGVAGALAQFAITNAYRFAGPPVVSPFDYTMMLWGVMFGYLLWGDLPTFYTYLGSVLLLTSSLAMFFMDYRSEKAQKLGSTS